MTDTRQVLEEAWEHLCQTSLSFRRYACTTIPGGDGWTMTGKFCRFLDAEAWTDAALMLVPDDGLHLALVRHLWADEPDKRWGYAVLTKYKRDSDGGRYYDREFTADHEVPALAIAQAALRAKEAGDV